MARWQPVADAEPCLFFQPILIAVHTAQRRHERGERGIARVPLIPGAGMLTYSIPEGSGHFTAVLQWTSTVMYWTCYAVVHQQSTLVANRHSRTSAWLSDDTGEWLVLFHNSTRTARGGSLLLNGPDHHNREPQGIRCAARKPGSSTKKSCQCPLCIYRTPAIQHSIL